MAANSGSPNRIGARLAVELLCQRAGNFSPFAGKPSPRNRPTGHSGPPVDGSSGTRLWSTCRSCLDIQSERADVRNGKVHLQVRAQDGSERQIEADHIIAATGYKTDLERLTFLSSEIRSKLKTVERTPVLSSNYESSMPGLYFVGVAAANSFGPVMRFAFGADFAARTVTRALVKSLSRQPVQASAQGVLTAK